MNADKVHNKGIVSGKFNLFFVFLLHTQNLKYARTTSVLTNSTVGAGKSAWTITCVSVDTIHARSSIIAGRENKHAT